MNLDRSVSPFEFYGTITSVEDAILIEHLFVAGETISGLAQRYYDDWRLWRIIAERNKIGDVRQVAPGTILLIPERPLETGDFERN